MRHNAWQSENNKRSDIQTRRKGQFCFVPKRTKNPADQSKLEVNVADAKRGKTSASELWLVCGARLLNQSCRWNVKTAQSIYVSSWLDWRGQSHPHISTNTTLSSCFTAQSIYYFKPFDNVWRGKGVMEKRLFTLSCKDCRTPSLEWCRFFYFSTICSSFRHVRIHVYLFTTSYK